MKHFPKTTDENSEELKIREDYWVKQICPYNLYDLNLSPMEEKIVNFLWYESMGGKDSVLTTVTELSKICRTSRNTIRDSLQSLSDLSIISYHDFGNGAEKQRIITFLSPLPNQKSDKTLAKTREEINAKTPKPKKLESTSIESEPKIKQESSSPQESKLLIDPAKCIYNGYQL